MGFGLVGIPSLVPEVCSKGLALGAVEMPGAEHSLVPYTLRAEALHAEPIAFSLS